LISRAPKPDSCIFKSLQTPSYLWHIYCKSMEIYLNLKNNYWRERNMVTDLLSGLRARTPETKHVMFTENIDVTPYYNAPPEHRSKRVHQNKWTRQSKQHFHQPEQNGNLKYSFQEFSIRLIDTIELISNSLEILSNRQGQSIKFHEQALATMERKTNVLEKLIAHRSLS